MHRARGRPLRAESPRPASRHQRWYQRHHAASSARSALRVWAFRNRTREIAESAIALGAICLPKAPTVAARSDAVAEAVVSGERAALLRELEASLVAGKAAEVKTRAKHLASEIWT